MPLNSDVSQQMKFARALIVMLICLSANASSPGQLELVGRFQNVETPDGEEHCRRYALDVWKADQRLLGLFHHHVGLCGDPPCAVLDAAELDPTTGQLTFSAKINGEEYAFRGRIGQHLTGDLNGQPVQLDRESTIGGDLASDRSISAWCTFWESVPRCRGVRDVCAKLQRRSR